MVATHNTSFWNINIQLTSHDDLTEKSVLAKPANKIIMVKKKLVEMAKNRNCTL